MALVNMELLVHQAKCSAMEFSCEGAVPFLLNLISEDPSVTHKTLRRINTWRGCTADQYNLKNVLYLKKVDHRYTEYTHLIQGAAEVNETAKISLL